MKQRKYRYNAPTHLRMRFLSVNLSKQLREKYGIRNITVRKNDRVKVLRGQHKNRTGRITNVDLKRLKVNVEGIEILKKSGTKSFYPLDPSNLQIIELSTEDKLRRIPRK